ncbi:hypothetical protein R1sor_002381 [Riccia sorocarpa]|uniref:Uncharacterized protein n=1 Tax=Riccia sorocarpa TaxID=122646 RepID=A0ABD3H1C0_9MARC
MRKVDNASQSAGITSGASFNNYQFDFGLGAGNKGASNAPLKDQKPTGSFSQPWSTPLAPKTGPSHSSTSWSQFQSASSGWGSQSKSAGGSSSAGVGGSSTTQQTWADYKPMSQPVGGSRPIQSQPLGGVRPLQSQPLGGMKPMNPAANPAYKPPSVAKFAAAGIAGVTETKSVDVFGDLLGRALNSSNTPLKKMAPKSSTASFSMGNLGSSLPNSSEEPVRQPTPPPPGVSKSKEPPARNNGSFSGGGGAFPDISGGAASSFSDDVFGFGGTSSTSGPAASSGSDDPFGFGSSSSHAGGSGGDPFAFGSRSGNPSPPQRRPSPSPMPDPFSVFAQKQTPSTQRKIADPMDELFSKSGPPPSKVPPPPPAAAADDDWGVFGSAASAGPGSSEPSTTELEGLPPPPAGVTAESACERGTDFYKNGQFPDAIKWLTWSVDLARGDKELTVKILTSRGSCFKEIGEMKKAVADCTKAIKLKPKDTNLIIQRASLYESMEKYKLALADLKLVTQLDPSNRAILGTLVRLQKMVDQ